MESVSHLECGAPFMGAYGGDQAYTHRLSTASCRVRDDPCGTGTHFFWFAPGQVSAGPQRYCSRLYSHGDLCCGTICRCGILTVSSGRFLGCLYFSGTTPRCNAAPALVFRL